MEIVRFFIEKIRGGGFLARISHRISRQFGQDGVTDRPNYPKDYEKSGLADKYKVVLRYLVSGGSSVVAQFGVLTVLVEQLHMDPTFSSAVGFVVGCIVNYLMLYYWTFKANGKHLVVAARYCLVTSFTLLLNISIFWTLTELLRVWYLLSQVFATGAVATINFLINRRFTFLSEESGEIVENKLCEQEQELDI